MSSLSRLAFLKSVADAVEGLDHFEIRLDHLELFAQPLDVAVDGAVVDVNPIVDRAASIRALRLLTTLAPSPALGE